MDFAETLGKLLALYPHLKFLFFSNKDNLMAEILRAYERENILESIEVNFDNNNEPDINFIKLLAQGKHALASIQFKEELFLDPEEEANIREGQLIYLDGISSAYLSFLPPEFTSEIFAELGHYLHTDIDLEKLAQERRERIILDSSNTVLSSTNLIIVSPKPIPGPSIISFDD